jgi:transposase
MIVDYTKVPQIYLVCGKTDLRRGIDGLASLYRLN